MFVCRRGQNTDGSLHIGEAVERGAAAIVAERGLSAPVPVIISEDVLGFSARLLRKFYLPNRHFGLIGVTGTNGKTTVTHIIKDILEHNGKRVGLIGTNGIFINGKKRGLYTSAPTTPGMCELWRIFAAIEAEGADFAVMEVSSHALALGRLRGCRFDVGVFTNLTRDHLDFHGSMEEYALAKRELFRISRTAVINTDDAAGMSFYSGFSGNKLSVGFSEADICLSALRSDGGGSDFRILCGELSAPVSIPLPGRFNVYNALCAVGACMLAGLDFSAAAEGASYARPVRGRCERVPIDADCSVIIDYAHTPDGLEKLIHTAKGITRAGVITVFGCGGDRDREKRPIMGELSGRLSDYTIITTDNPRSEEPMAIISDIYEGIRKTKGKYCIVPEREMAISHAMRLAKPGDIVLLAGKGHENYQIIKGKKYHFDEREIVKKYIQKG